MVVSDLMQDLLDAIIDAETAFDRVRGGGQEVGTPRLAPDARKAIKVVNVDPEFLRRLFCISPSGRLFESLDDADAPQHLAAAIRIDERQVKAIASAAPCIRVLRPIAVNPIRTVNHFFNPFVR